MRAAALLAVLAATAGAAPAAHADGDPASDYLTSVNAFVPFGPGPSAPDNKTSATLDKLLTESQLHGHGYKVAVIHSTLDLGSITVLFGQPQRYATFLYSEIKPFVNGMPHGTLMVVMQKGVGLVGGDATAAGRAAAAKVQIPRNASSTQLVQAATDAVYAVSKANGHPLAHVTASVPGKSHTKRWIIAGLIVLLLVGGTLIAMGLRTHVPAAEVASDE
jgi:hypothetical protein